MQERMRWASVQVPFRVLSDEVPQLVADIAAFDRDTSSALVAGLLTVPAYQSSGLRIELLAGLVVLHARGKRRATIEDLARWFAMLGASGAAAGEDAAEDVMVTLVTTSSEQFRILEGLWESAGFYTQRVLDVLAGMPDTGIYRSVRDSVRALLSVAEIVCMRAGLERYQTGSDARPDALDIASLPTACDLCARATITHAALQKRDVALEDLAPFLLQSQHVTELMDQEPGISELERRPLISVPDGVVLALPTAVTVAIRQWVIDLVLGTRQVGHFDGHYARALSNAIADTTLLGWKSGCPVLWHPTEGGALAGVVVPFDRGHFVVLHFVLPSVASHELGWFKRPINIHPTLQKALNYSIASNTQKLESQDDFRGGMHLVVMCGWGQGMVIPVTRPDDARWRGEAMSVADLVRASSVEDMSIQRLWHLVSAEKALVDAGVELMNVNGVLNLFAWMQKNDGHLVPHGDLDDGRISPEQRLMVSLPLNLLRDLRAEADRNVDAHVEIDPRGEPHHLHRVDRGSLFSHPAAERLYACTECLRSGTLLAACEGRTTLWLRVDSPGVSSRDIEFRLWDMVGRWGASIAAALEDGTDIKGAVEITIAFEDVQSELDAVDAQVPTDPLELLRVEVVGAEAVTVHAARGFLHAWREPSLLDAIEDYAIKRRAPILQIRHGELVALLACRCDAAIAERFIDQLLLARRPCWAQPPQGFKSREILPWRFGRRLSIVTRPIVQMNDEDDALYMLAPRLVRSGFFYLLRGAFHGTLDQSFFQTPAMRDAWWGKANEGHTFNALVADQLRAAGWEVRAGIELTAVLNAKLDRDYGDVDVLAWCPGGEEVFVVECKDLSFRRNYSEIAALLSDYQGGFKNGKPDKLKRHLMRVECAASHLPAVARFTGVAAPKIRSCLLVAGLVPMQFASIPALEGTFVGDVDQFGAHFGQCRRPST